MDEVIAVQMLHQGLMRAYIADCKRREPCGRANLLAHVVVGYRLGVPLRNVAPTDK